MQSFLDTIWNWIKDALYWIFNTLSVIADWFGSAVFYIVKGVLYLILDGILIVIKTFIYALDLSALGLQFAAGHGLIPEQAAYFMCAIGFPQFVSLMVIAYSIRFSMNLIPTVMGTGIPNL